jgi:hypothetical protein
MSDSLVIQNDLKLLECDYKIKKVLIEEIYVSLKLIEKFVIKKRRPKSSE